MKEKVVYLGGDERVEYLLKEHKNDLELIEKVNDTLSKARERAKSAPNDKVRAKANEIAKGIDRERAKLLDGIAMAIGRGRVSAVMLSKIHQSKIR